MQHTETAKPATACAVSELRNVEQLAGRLEDHISDSAEYRQVCRLARLYSMTIATAATIARLVYAAGPR
jgi:hypothetical protein